MKLKKSSVFSLGALAVLILAGCKGTVETITVTGDYFTGKLAKTTYNAYLGSTPTTLDATKSQSAENVTHLANFEDCLVMNDEFGILRKSIASKVEKSADGRTFSFTIRDDIPWVRNTGEQYTVNGNPQFVTAEDFVTTAKLILDFKNNSEIYYMYTLFVSNAWEYYCYTMMQQYITNQTKDPIDGYDYTNCKGNNAEQAARLAILIKRYSGNEPENEITAGDIRNIGQFKRVGVAVENGKLVYKLNQRADFFPTMLTYTPFTPINATFYKETSAYGSTDPTKILYCGPYLLKELSATSVKYAKNDLWHNAGKVHIKNVNFTVVSSSLSYAEMRQAFDRGEVDGFSLNAKDEEGWKKYITGEDGSGTIQDPANPSVNSRELDDVDYTYHFVLNQNRSTESVSYANSTIYGTMSNEQIEAAILNTNKALKIREVRKLVLDGIDFESYNERYNAPEDNQYQMNTFTPRGYVYDEYNKDYVDYYYETYARQKGLVPETASSEVAIAKGKEFVRPQQIAGVNATENNAYEWLNMKTIRENAIKAVQAYNSQIATSEAEKITTPVLIENLGVGSINAEDLEYEQVMVRNWNERANGCTINSKRVTEELPLCANGASGKPAYPYFEMKNSTPSNSSSFSNVAQNGYYTIYTGWGWVGDYADPLTYMHCYVTNGEMSKMSGNNTEFDNFRYNAATNTITKDADHMFKAYNELVDEARQINDSNSQRFSKFAECEYMLLNDLYIIKPSYMSTQGWAASVSRAIGYENPSAHYGLADNILSGMWVLYEEIPSGEDRKAARELQAEKKEAALIAVGRDTISPIYAD